MTWKFVTIPASHYCDKARWAMDRAGIAYDEHGHIPMLHWLEATRQKGTRTVPIVVHEAGVATDSTDILELIDARLAETQRLFPVEPARRAEVAAWEEKFDKYLGPSARRVVYFHMLPDKALTLAVLGAHCPPHELALLKLGFPLFKRLMYRGMNITPKKAKQSHAKLDDLFAEVSAALSDGRRYLCGDRLTAADVTFAALSAPVILPPGHPKMDVALDRLAPAMRETVEALRATPAGQFALRLYREDRTARA